MAERLAEDWVQRPTKENTFKGWAPKVLMVGDFEVVLGMWAAHEGDAVNPRPGMMVDGVIVDDRPEYIAGNDDDPRPQMPISNVVANMIRDYNDQMPDAVGKAFAQRVQEYVNAHVEVDDSGKLVDTDAR